MIYLHVQLDQVSEEGHILQTDMSMVCAGYGGTISLPPSRSFWSFARLTFGINALARPIDAANKLGSPIVYLMVHQNRRNTERKEMKDRKHFKNKTYDC
jgi:hypothetical protein